MIIILGAMTTITGIMLLVLADTTADYVGGGIVTAVGVLTLAWALREWVMGDWNYL